MPLPSENMANRDKGRIRPKTVKVWRCGACGATFDAAPRNFECPECGGAGSGIVESRTRDDFDGWRYPKKKGQRPMDTLKSAIQDAGLAPRVSDIDLSQYLKGGGRVVVLGGRTTNFTDQMRRHPQFEFWDSTDPKAHGKDLPSNARALLITRFMDHGWEGRIRRQARERGVFNPPGWLTTGDIRDVLQKFIDSPAAKLPVHAPGNGEAASTPLHVEPAPKTEALAPIENVAALAPAAVQEETMPKVDTNRVGWLRAFCAEHADLDAPVRAAEAARVLKLLAAGGAKSTPAAVAQTIYALRRAAGKPMSRGGDHRTVRGAGILTTADVATPARAASAAPAPPRGPDVFVDELAAAMHQAEDALTRLDDAREAMKLAIGGLRQVQLHDKARREKMAAIKRALQE